MAENDDINMQFGRVLLSDALGRLDQLKHKVAGMLDEAQDTRFIATLRADVAHNEINQRVARINGQDEELERLHTERLLLDAALDSATNAG